MKKYKNNFISFFCTLFILLFAIGFFYLSNNYNQIYNIPSLNDTNLNISDYDFENRKVDYLLNGKWEFYYNQWIITDNESELTGLIDLPNHWNDVYDLSKNGYASYKINIEGLKKDLSLSIVLNNFRGTYRCFINEQLVSSSGELSKDSNYFVSGCVDYKNPFIVSNETSVELTIEIGFNNFGGFYSVPWLTASSFSKNTSSLSNTIHFITMIMIGALICLSIILLFVYFGLKKYDYSFVFDFLFCLFLLLNQICSKDGGLLINKFNVIDYRIANFLSYLFLAISLFFLYRKTKNKIFNILEIFSLSLFVFIGVISFTKWNFLLVLLLLTLLIYYLNFRKNKTISTSLIITLFIILCFVELVDCLGFIVFGAECIPSLILLSMIFLITFSILIKIKQLSKNGLKVKELEMKLLKEESKVLSNQMQPHFIFNTLTSIKSLYNEDKEVADKMLIDFSKHLRYQIEALQNEFVSFEDEINNIENFVELYLLRKNFNVEVLYNLEDIDFNIPAFSIEPFVENSLKYAFENTGQIIISSKRNNDVIEIKIIDNGCGFDYENISKKSVGIKNSINRLKLLLDAEVIITSKINIGTEVKITYKDKNEKNSDC